MATYCSIFAWSISRTEEPGRRQFTGSQSWTRLTDYHWYSLIPVKVTIFVHSSNHFRTCFVPGHSVDTDKRHILHSWDSPSLETTWMDLEISILSDVSQTEKDKYHMISCYMWTIIFKMIQTNLYTKQKQTYRFWKQM